MAPEPFVFWLLTGLVVGLVASIFLGTSSIWKYLAAGVAGAVIISYGVTMFGVAIPINGWLIRQLSVATVGAAFFIVVFRVME